MDPEYWKQVAPILEEAVSLPDRDVNAYLDRACAGDPDLRREVEALLSHTGSTRDFTPRNAAEVAAQVLRGDVAALTPGSRLASYIIEATEGRGGMGVVYRARDEKLQRQVAIKILLPGILDTGDGRKRFLKEARALAQISHPNILTVYDVDRASDLDFIAMEWVDGRRLDHVIGKAGLPLDDVLKYAIQIADALSQAHAKGIIHRDLKPSNVMITSGGFVKVLDFGLAKVPPAAAADSAAPQEDSSTLEGKVFGTAAYMSPEQAQGQNVDSRSDLFSFGTVLYEMLSGRRAFVGQSIISTIAAIIKEEPAPLDKRVPEPLRMVVERCLRKDPARRFQTMADVKLELEEIRDQRLRGHGPKGNRSLMARLKAAAPVSILVLIVAVLGTVLLLSSRRAAPIIPSFEISQVTGSHAWEGEPEISPDGNRIAFSSNAEGNLEIYVTDLSGAARLNLTNDPADDSEPAWFPDGANIAFTATQGGRSEIRKTSSIGGGAAVLVPDAVEPALSPDGSRIAYSKVVPNGYRIAVAPLQLLTRETMLSPVLTERGSPAWAPDSRTLCYVDSQDLWTVSTAGGAPTRLTSDATHKYDPVWSPDGRRIYYASLLGGGRALWCVATRGGAPVRVTDGISEERHPSISTDGRRLIFATSGAQPSLVLLDRNSGETSTLPVKQWFLSLPAISADGSKVIFSPKRSGPDFDLWAEPLKNGRPYRDPIRISDGQGNLQHPALSPDGRWIACYRLTGNQREIVILSSAGGPVLQITHGPAQSATPAWSRDGCSIAFVSYTHEASEIVTVRVSEVLDTFDARRLGTRRKVATASAAAYGPVWSPDGKQLAFVDGSSDDNDIWLVPADGSGPARGLTRGARAKFVRWDSSTGDLLVSGSWDEKGVTLRRVSPASGIAVPFSPAIDFGGSKANGLFDVAADAEWLVFAKEESAGQICMLQATKGVF